MRSHLCIPSFFAGSALRAPGPCATAWKFGRDKTKNLVGTKQEQMSKEREGEGEGSVRTCESKESEVMQITAPFQTKTASRVWAEGWRGTKSSLGFVDQPGGETRRNFGVP